MGNFSDFVSGRRIIQEIVQELAAPNGLIGQLQRQVAIQNSRIYYLERELAIMSNRTKGNGYTMPFSIVINASGNRPPIAIRNTGQLSALGEPDADSLCSFYGINPMPTTLNGKQRAIANEIGVLNNF